MIATYRYIKFILLFLSIRSFIMYICIYIYIRIWENRSDYLYIWILFYIINYYYLLYFTYRLRGLNRRSWEYRFIQIHTYYTIYFIFAFFINHIKNKRVLYERAYVFCMSPKYHNYVSSAQALGGEKHPIRRSLLIFSLIFFVEILPK